MNLVEAAHARLENARAELVSAKAFLRHADIPEMRPEAKAVLDFIGERFDYPAFMLCGPARIERIVRARGFAMYLMRSVHGLTTEEIGQYLQRDRSTVEQALQTVADRRDTDKKYRLELSALVTDYAPANCHR